METMSGCRLLKVNMKAKIYLYVNSTTQRCPNKIITFFLIEDFSHLPPVSTTPVVHLQPWISPWIFEKIWNGFNGIGGNWFMKKTRSKKSCGTVPLRTRTREPPPLFCGNPPPCVIGQGMEMVIRQSDRITFLPGRVGGRWSSNTKVHLILAFDSSYMLV